MKRVFYYIKYNMKWVNITRYTSWDGQVVQALWTYWVAYDISVEEWEKVTTLNRIKNFLSGYLHIKNPTKKLVSGILSHTGSWKFLWEGIDLTWNVCNFFLIKMKEFKNSAMSLIETWLLVHDKEKLP